MNISTDVLSKVAAMLRDKVYVHAEGETDYLTQNYTDLEEIGEGSFGIVYKAKKINSADPVAIKGITLKFDQDYNDQAVHSTSARDGTMLKRVLENCQEAVLQSEVLKHVNVATVHEKWIQHAQQGNKDELSGNLLEIVNHVRSGTFEMTERFRNALIRTAGLQFCLAMDLYETDLNKWLIQRDINDDTNTQSENILYDLAIGLEHIHSHGYIHNDIKPRNVLVKKEGGRWVAALSDFGLAKRVLGGEPEEVNHETSDKSGTKPYNTAPDDIYTTAFDMWSVGLITYKLGKHTPVMDKELHDLVNSALDAEVAEFLEAISSNIIRSAAGQCFKCERVERCDATTLSNIIRPEGIPVML